MKLENKKRTRDRERERCSGRMQRTDVKETVRKHSSRMQRHTAVGSTLEIIMQNTLENVVNVVVHFYMKRTVTLFNVSVSLKASPSVNRLDKRRNERENGIERYS